MPTSAENCNTDRYGICPFQAVCGEGQIPFLPDLHVAPDFSPDVESGAAVTITTVRGFLYSDSRIISPFLISFVEELMILSSLPSAASSSATQLSFLSATLTLSCSA